MRLLEKEHLYRSDRGTLLRWADTIARRITSGNLRRRGKEPVEELVDDTADIPELSVDQIGWVLEQYGRLDDPERHLLSLRYFEGLSTTLIAQRLGISQPAVSKRLSKVLDRLRRRARLHGLLSAFLPFPLAKAIAGASPTKKTIAVVLSVLAVTSATAFFLPDPKTHLIANTRDLPHTSIVAELEVPLDPQQNTAWSASLPVPWHELVLATGGPIRATGNPTIDALNPTATSRADVAPDGLVATAGLVRDGVVERTQQLLEARFGHGPDPVLEHLASPLKGGDLLAYAFLARALEFAPSFDPLRRYLHFQYRVAGKSEDEWVKVTGFGIDAFDDQNPKHRRLRETVDVIDWRGQQDFIVRLRPTDASEEVLLARIPVSATLADTVSNALTRARTGKVEALRNKDELAIPVIDFHLTHDFDELQGTFVNTTDGSPYRSESESLAGTRTSGRRADSPLVGCHTPDNLATNVGPRRRVSSSLQSPRTNADSG